MCSVGETTAKKLITTHPEEFVNHNKTFLTRVYPSGKRVDSSNYMPVEMWNYGCQMGKETLVGMRVMADISCHAVQLFSLLYSGFKLPNWRPRDGFKHGQI
jgi:hypothetical protein